MPEVPAMSVVSTTAKYRAILQSHGYNDRDCDTLALGQERPSFLWALLSPLAYNLRMVLHIVGVDKRSGDLVLYKVQKGFFSLIAGIDGRDAISLDRLRNLRYSSGLFTSTLRFTDPDGVARTLTFPWGEKGAADALFADQALVAR
jgi:hypothetical protein